jgi:hypothetical protein
MPGPKQNNRRIYPDANRQPRHKAADRKMRAEVRQELASELTLEQKIAKLPPEPYAAKQRARYAAQLVKRNAPKPEVKNDAPKQEVAADNTVKQNKTKKYMKGSK